jgi:hypothetical protein
MSQEKKELTVTLTLEQLQAVHAALITSIPSRSVKDYRKEIVESVVIMQNVLNDE